jgi:hypothetical protein
LSVRDLLQGMRPPFAPARSSPAAFPSAAA